MRKDAKTKAVMDEINKINRLSSKLNLYVLCSAYIDWEVVDLQSKVLKRQFDKTMDMVQSMKR